MGTIEPVDKRQDTKHQYVPERMYIPRQLCFSSNLPPGTRHKGSGGGSVRGTSRGGQKTRLSAALEISCELRVDFGGDKIETCVILKKKKKKKLRKKKGL